MRDKLDSAAIRAHKGISFTGVTTSFLCYNLAGEFVLAKRSQNARDEQGKWDSGGGGLKHGVRLEDNVRREIKEEYGADCLQITYLGYDEIFRELDDRTPTHWISFRYAVLVDKSQVKNNEPESFDDFGWFTLDTLPSPLHSQQIPFFEKYQQQLKAYIH